MTRKAAVTKSVPTRSKRKYLNKTFNKIFKQKLFQQDLKEGKLQNRKIV